MPRDNLHWQYEDHKQRVTTKDWKDLLLNNEDHVIFHGKTSRLLAKRIGPGVYEVFKEPLKNA